tara:strand:+ start:225 stop:413 length:189 start_codon:yes stop_codon:yes gene_type:complete
MPEGRVRGLVVVEREAVVGEEAEQTLLALVVAEEAHRVALGLVLSGEYEASNSVSYTRRSGQ